MPVAAFGMPRGDVLEALSPEPPAGEPRERVLGSRADRGVAAGDTVVVRCERASPTAAPRQLELARSRSRRGAEPAGARAAVAAGSGPLVAVAMATHEPSPELLRRQLDSIAAQTHTELGLRRQRRLLERRSGFAEIEEAIGDDPRFVLSRSPARLGFYATSSAPWRWCRADADVRRDGGPGRPLAARQARGAARRRSATRSSSTATPRIVDARRRAARAAPTGGRAATTTSDISSAADGQLGHGRRVAVPARAAGLALPFPPGQFPHFHDHWIGLMALSLGRHRVRRPARSTTTSSTASAVLGPRRGERHADARRPPARLASARCATACGCWRLTYFVDACRLLQFATDPAAALRGPRWRRTSGARSSASCAPTARPPSSAGSPRAPARELVGRPETLGAELGLFFGFAWRHLVRGGRRGPASRRERLRARRAAAAAALAKPGAARARQPRSVRVIAREDRSRSTIAVREDAPRARQPADPDDRPRATSSAATSASSTSPAGWRSAGRGCGS